MADNEKLSGPEEVKASSVHLRGELSRPPSRALWLVKWLLVFPNALVLMFLFITMPFVLLIVFFAVIFTGKYPRGLFNYVVGVQRWYWRVVFYASVCGTDRYPPFSLRSKDDYPADFHVDYPERLRQWMPLVKWFLAIPHYFVLIALLYGSIISSSSSDDEKLKPLRGVFSYIEIQTDDSEMHDALVESSQKFSVFSETYDDYSYKGFPDFLDSSRSRWGSFPGLFGILVLIALIALLFTGRYHKDIFHLIMGIWRWAYRVNAYVYLLTDEYPHFRLTD